MAGSHLSLSLSLLFVCFKLFFCLGRGLSEVDFGLHGQVASFSSLLCKLKTKRRLAHFLLNEQKWLWLRTAVVRKTRHLLLWLKVQKWALVSPSEKGLFLWDWNGRVRISLGHLGLLIHFGGLLKVFYLFIKIMKSDFFSILNIYSLKALFSIAYLKVF